MASHHPQQAYSQPDMQTSIVEDHRKLSKVNRKVIPPQTSGSQREITMDIANLTLEPLMEGKEVVYPEAAPRLPPRRKLSQETVVPVGSEDLRLYSSPARTDTNSSIASTSTAHGHGSSRSDSFPTTLSATSTGSVVSTTSHSSASSNLKKAYDEARHFAGGLMSRPIESTKHFSIMRHSHGLVFYQGSSTSLAISIFSDEPLPSDRTLWLQSKGWTGKTGMRAKAFVGVTGSWLNVTPTVAVGTEQLIPTDERAWQRDFQKFRKKAPSRIRDRHQLRETAVVRIPAEAGDGYFQLVLCTGDKKKVLCTSPAFRVLSTSTQPSSIRGASLSSLPFELGAMALAIYGRSTLGSTVSILTSPCENAIQQYLPSFWTRKAAGAAYQLSGAGKKIDGTAADAQRIYERARDEALAIAEDEALALEEGPKHPYPITFIAGCKAVENSAEPLNPVIQLSVPASISHALHGYYFGWARHLPKHHSRNAKHDPADPPWFQAMLSALLVDVSQLARVSVGLVNEKKFELRISQDADEDIPSGVEKFEIRVMGFIRPDEPTQRLHMEEGLLAGEEAAHEASMLVEANDFSMIQGILEHPSWSVDAGERQTGVNMEEKRTRLERLKKGYADARLATQKGIDRVPFHKAGVRMPGDKLRDKGVVMNGFYVIR